MKKILLLSSLVGSLFANEVGALKTANAFLSALKNMDNQQIEKMLPNENVSLLGEVDNHIIYFRDVQVQSIAQVGEFGHYVVTLNNEEFNTLELQRDNNGEYKIIGL